MNQIAFPFQDSAHCMSDVSADLTHPEFIGAGCYARDLYSSTRQINSPYPLSHNLLSLAETMG
jgi:hypothetical protein